MAEETTWQVWREPACVDMSDRRAVAADLAAHMRDFLDLRDVSPAVVGHIEHLLDSFADTDWHEELDVPVASYEPWGSNEGPWFYTVEELGRLFRWALPRVEEEAGQGQG